MSKIKQQNQRLAQFWKHHIDQWSKSELTQNAYCRKNNLRPNRFTYWKKKFQTQNLPTEIVPLSVVQVAQMVNTPDQRDLRLNIDAGLQIEIPENFCQATLGRVLQVLGKL